MNNTKIGAALLGGYVLGRTKKAKFALSLGALLAGSRVRPGELGKVVQRSPFLNTITHQVRSELTGAGKAAATSVMTAKAGSLADALHERTVRMQEKAQPGGDGEAADSEREPEESDQEQEPAESEREPAEDDRETGQAEEADKAEETGGQAEETGGQGRRKSRRGASGQDDDDEQPAPSRRKTSTAAGSGQDDEQPPPPKRKASTAARSRSTTARSRRPDDG
ncbi:ABC transporter substrate-binding protein [Streptomyces sp. NPDC018693]|uniref:ABC transporter substrate-binding protein n=1 Tax=unclassified Streptomyces TaxID=2593676 RepID=UPI0037BC8182